MAGPPAHSGYAFPGMENLHKDIYPAISVAETPSLKQPGKVVLVTGASKGIGRAIAIQYAHASVACLILCARSASILDEVEAEIKKIDSSIKVLKFALDVTDDAAVQSCAAEVTSRVGKLDVLINNAGTSSPWVPLTETEPKGWWQTLEVNLKGPYLMLQAFLPLLVSTAEKNGTITNIINVSSIGAHVTNPGASAYQVSKLAVLRLTEFVNVEYGAKGVNAVAIHPGGVPTEMGLAEPSIRPFMTDTPELCGGFCVWLSAGKRTWLAARYLSATWDVEKIESMKEEIVKGDLLKVRMAV